VLPAFVLFGAFVLFHLGVGPVLVVPSTTLLAVAVALASAEAGRLFRRPPPPLPPSIGAFIRVLLPLQAALCLTFSPMQRLTAGGIVAGVLLVLLPVARTVGRRFYAS
jgi:hypothetical protein